MDSNRSTGGPLRWLGRGIFCLILPLIVVASSQAQAPVMEEQLVYRLRLFDGKGYAGSFCPRSERTIYTISGSNNVLVPTMTLVYYWPITRRYKAAFKTLNESIEGTLEIIQGGKIIHELIPRTYTFSYVEEPYARTSEILLDERAKQRHSEYLRVMEKYTEQLKRYRERKQAYQRQMEAFFAKVQEQGKSKTTSRSGRISVPKEPPFPEAPRFLVEDPGAAYIINLPVGRYRIRLRAPDGSVVEGSEKNLLSFTHRRSGKVGYEVVPAERWTMPETSSDPAEIIYLNGKKTLYLRAYLQTEYNHLYYAKLLDPQSEGYSELWHWVNIQQIEKGTLQLFKDGEILERIEEKPYYVKQVPGPELGYTIVDQRREDLSDRAPSLVGYRLEFEPERGAHWIQLVDASGELVPGSVREIRMVEMLRSRDLYLGATLLPLAVGVPILIWRRRKLK